MGYLLWSTFGVLKLYLYYCYIQLYYGVYISNHSTARIKQQLQIGITLSIRIFSYTGS